MNIFLRLWKWLRRDRKLEIVAEAIYGDMWKQIVKEDEENYQKQKDNKNISENLKLAGFDLD